MNRVEQLLMQLKHASPTRRESAALELAYLGDESALQPLRDLCRDRMPNVRRAALRALASLRLEAAIPDVIQALEEGDHEQQAAAEDALLLFGASARDALLAKLHPTEGEKTSLIALRTLGRFQGLCTAQMLLPLLDSPDWPVRQQTVRTLGVLRDRAAIPALLATLAGTDTDLRALAAESLGCLGGESTAATLARTLSDREAHVRTAAARGLGLLAPDIYSPELSQALQDPQAHTRELAVTVLGLGRDPHHRPELIPLLQDEAVTVRLATAQALHKLFPQEPQWQLLEQLHTAAFGSRLAALAGLCRLRIWDASAWLLPWLKDPDPEMRAAIVLAIATLGGRRHVLAISPLLQDPDPQVRLATVEALSELGGLQAVEMLVPSLADPDLTVRQRIEQVLAKLQPQDPLWPLLQQVYSSDEDLRTAALDALSKLQDLRAVFSLSALLEAPDTSEAMQIAILATLGSLRALYALPILTRIYRQSPAQPVRLAAIQALPKLANEPAAWPTLLEALADRSGDLREAAVQALSQAGPGVIPDVLPLLEADPWFLREAALRILAAIPEAPVYEHLAAALQERDRDVRRTAVGLLGKRKDPRALDPLIDALANGYRDVRAVAARALGDLGERLASRELELALREDEYPDVRAAAAWALGALGRETSLINLLQALDEDDDESVRAAAATALRHYPDAPLEPVVAALKDPDLVVALAAIQTLGAWGRPEAEPFLIRSLEQGDGELRTQAARALGELNPPPRQALLQALSDEDQPLVQQALLSSLVHLSPEPQQQEQLEIWYEQASSDERLSLLRLLPAPGCDALPLLLRGALVEEDTTLCLEAIHVCGALAPPELFDPLVQLALRDELAEVRAAAREALGYYPPEQVLDLLMELLQQDPLTEPEAVMGALMAQGEAAVPPLIEMLHSWNPEWRQRAWDSLRLLSHMAVPGLLAALQKAPPEVMMAIIHLLERLRPTEAIEPLIGILESENLDLTLAASHALRTLEPGSRPELLALLDSPRRGVRFATAELLSYLQRTDPLWAVLLGLNSEDAPERLAAAMWLQEQRDGRALVNVRQALAEETHIAVLRELLRALGGIAQDEDIGRITPFLQHAHRDIREASVQALGLCAAFDALDRLIPLLQDSDRGVRQATLPVLGRLGAIEQLQRALQDTDPEVRTGALRWLGTLRALGAQTDIEGLLLSDPIASVREAAALTLGELDAAQALPVFLTALEQDSAPEVCRAVIASLHDLRALPTLHQMLERPAYLMDISVLRTAVAALARYAHPSSLPVLEQVLLQPCWGDRELRVLAAKALVRQNPEAVRSIFERCLTSSDRDLRQAAEEGLQLLAHHRELTPERQAINP